MYIKAISSPLQVIINLNNKLKQILLEHEIQFNFYLNATNVSIITAFLQKEKKTKRKPMPLSLEY